MKKILLSLSLLLFAAVSVHAQKMAYVDTEYIMGQIPEYKSAQDEIERISQQWQEELEAKYQAIEQLYADYQAQEVLLPEDVKQEKQEEIFQAEREAKEYREKKFGYDGELFALQESKMKPIQDRVFRAVETIAKRRRFDLVFDKAGEVTWLYTNATYDLSNEVLEEMGFPVPGNE
ncbi:MAG: OmpH family outer membrane protein [Bacteroidetes bacterium]|nr:MAG: OmpH family outer membrane protein [Bacteroidota bacterium]